MSKPRRVGRRMIRQRNGNMRRKFRREVERARWRADFTGRPINIYRIPHESWNAQSGQDYRSDVWGWSPFFPVLYCAMTVHPRKDGDA